MQVEDSEILTKFAQENTRDEAFRLLLTKYQQKVYWHIRRMVISHDDTDDLVQDVFLKVWKSLSNFRNDSQLYTWLYRIATNESITFLKRKKIRNSVSIDDDDGKNMVKKPSEEVSQALKGPKGTTIQVKVLRNDKDEVMLSITRDEIKIPDVPYANIIGNGIGYIGSSAVYGVITLDHAEFHDRELGA